MQGLSAEISPNQEPSYDWAKIQHLILMSSLSKQLFSGTRSAGPVVKPPTISFANHMIPTGGFYSVQPIAMQHQHIPDKRPYVAAAQQPQHCDAVVIAVTAQLTIFLLHHKPVVGEEAPGITLIVKLLIHCANGLFKLHDVV